MGEESVGDMDEPSNFVTQESSSAGCTSALDRTHSVAGALGSDDSLNHGNISLLQRLDRLDNILSLMEIKAMADPNGNSCQSPHGSRRISLTTSSLEKHCKSTESVLEEVEEKGSLVERVSELEKRFMNLHRMISTKSSGNVVYPGLVDATASAYSISAHDQAISQHDDHEQSLPDLIDVEKHEVTAVSSASLEHDPQHKAPAVYSEKLDDSPQKKEPPPHTEGDQGMVLTEATWLEEDRGPHRQKSGKKTRKLKQWLLNQFHIWSSTQQGKRIYSTGHCWSSHSNPKSCWNLKRGEVHSSSPYTHYAHNPIDEDSP